MAKVIGYLNDEEVYSKECSQSEINIYILEALNSWGSIDDLGNIEVEVENDDGYVWTPV